MTLRTGIKTTAISRIRRAIRANFLRIRRLHSLHRQLTSDTIFMEPTTEKSPPSSIPWSAIEPMRHVAETPCHAVVAGSSPADGEEHGGG